MNTHPETGERPRPTPETVSAGQALLEHTLSITRADLVRYADASGDHNPIHLDDDAARALGLPGVVAHGMLTAARAIGVVAQWAGGADQVLSTDIRFASPVVVPETGAATIRVAPTVRSVNTDTNTATIVLSVTCDGVKVLGKAMVVVALDRLAK